VGRGCPEVKLKINDELYWFLLLYLGIQQNRRVWGVSGIKRIKFSWSINVGISVILLLLHSRSGKENPITGIYCRQLDP